MTALLLASGCDRPCTDADQVPVLDPDGLARPGAHEVVRQAIGDFTSWTGRTCLELDSVTLVDDIEVGWDDEFEAVGLYHQWKDDMLLEANRPHASLRITTVHELCHALDHTERLSRSDRQIWFEAIGRPEALPRSLHAPESFAQLCEYGPSTPLEQRIRARCELEPEPWRVYMDEVVYPQSPAWDAESPAAVIEASAPQRWSLDETGAVMDVVPTDTGLAVVVGHPLGWGWVPVTVVFLGLDPLREVARTEVLPFDAEGSHVGAVVGGAEGVWLIDGAEAEAPVRVLPDGSMERGRGIPAGLGRATVWGGELVYTEPVGEHDRSVLRVLDLKTGELRDAGVPELRDAWSLRRTGGRIEVRTEDGLWAGDPDSGWAFSPEVFGFDRTRLPGGRVVGRARVEGAARELSVWYVQEPDGTLRHDVDPCDDAAEGSLWTIGGAVHALDIDRESATIEARVVRVGD